MHKQSWVICARRCVLWLGMGLVLQAKLAAAGEVDQLLPQNLLGLIHAPEVQTELGLSDEQRSELVKLFAEIDGEWFRARIQPPESQFPVVKQLENRVREWLTANGTKDQLRRLNQLEAQSFGARILLHQGLAGALKLDATQQARVLELARATAAANKSLQEGMQKNSVTDELTKAAQQALAEEQKMFTTVLRAEQLEKLKQLVGKPFDTAGLKRIYPMAPELEPVEDWINSSPLTLAGLRGKVVLLHFYAFQCHNCHANFGHYSKWHKEFGDRVVVIGIQSPETPAEREPERVRQAAKDQGMRYPICIDLEMKNWNAWANTMWPTVYVIDQEGYLRHWWQGELNWNGATGDKVIEDLVRGLLNE